MSNVSFQPRPLAVLGDAPRIKGYVHPVRMAILRLLTAEKRTVTGVAREMKVHPANLTHHFKLLERLRLIRLVETRDTGRNLEKYYVSVARSFLVRPRARSRVSRQALALSIVRDHLSAAIDRIRTGDPALALLTTTRLGKRDVVRFAARLRALVAEFQRADAADGRSFNLNLSLYPDEVNAVRASRTRVEIR